MNFLGRQAAVIAAKRAVSNKSVHMDQRNESLLSRILLLLFVTSPFIGILILYSLGM